jgi:hypothetical protein
MRRNKKVVDPEHEAWMNSVDERLMAKKLGQNSMGFISRASEENSAAWAKVAAANFQWSDSVGEDDVMSTTYMDDAEVKHLTATDLSKLGYELHARTENKEEAHANQIILAKKGVNSHMLKSGTTIKPVFEVWSQKHELNPDGFGSRVSNFNGKNNYVTEKKAKYVIPNHIEKIAWDIVENKGLLNGMRYKAFDCWASNDGNGVWWKETVADEETGEKKTYLVRQRDVSKGIDAGGKNVKGITQKVAKTEKIVKKAKKTEDHNDTAAVNSSATGVFLVDLTKSDWKKEVDDYLKKCKHEKMQPKQMEVRVTEWTPDDI